MNLIASLVPYIAVVLGMYIFHSAWLAILLYHAGIVALLAFRRDSEQWKRLRNGVNAAVLIPGMVVCALAAPVVYFMWPWFASTENILPEWLAKYGLTGPAWFLLMPYFSIVHPALEELHWRGISPERVAGLCGQDLLFAGYHVLVLFQLLHWPWLFLVFGVLAGGSFFWRWTAGRFGGYAIAVLTHAVADVSVLLGIHFLLRA